MKNELILSIIAIFISFIALLAAIGRLFAALHPIWVKYRNQAMLKDRFARGPYDEATIIEASRHYILPKCSEIDLTQEVEMSATFNKARKDLFAEVDHFLDREDSCRHLLILADSGTGKTSFVLNYYAHNERRPIDNRHQLALVPLGIPDALSFIHEIPEKDVTSIFLDAFDEDVKAIEDHRSRIGTLMNECRMFKRVIITCRTQFFTREEEIPNETGLLRIGPIRAGERREYEFKKLYLCPFDDLDIKQYIKQRYPIWEYHLRKKFLYIVRIIPLLATRPMLLSHIPDLIKTGIEVQHSYQLYEVMISAWLERETAWADKTDLRDFSEYLAKELYLKREVRGMERIPEQELSELAKNWSINLNPKQISGRSLLNRDAQGNYKFAHRSIMEYLFVLRLIKGDSDCCEMLLTDQMKIFLAELIFEGTITADVKNLLSEIGVIARGLTIRLLNREKIADSTGLKELLPQDSTLEEWLGEARMESEVNENIDFFKQLKKYFEILSDSCDIKLKQDGDLNHIEVIADTRTYVTPVSVSPATPAGIVFLNLVGPVATDELRRRHPNVNSFISRYGLDKIDSIITFNKNPKLHLKFLPSDMSKFLLFFQKPPDIA